MFFMLQNKSLIKYFIAMFVLCSVLVIFSACTSHDNGTPQTPQENYYSVTYIAADGGVIEGKTEQTVKEGENAEAVTAVPNEGYLFVKWSDGVTIATRQDAHITFSISVTAEFEIDTYTVQYLVGEGGIISGNANQQVKYGKNAEEVTAVPNEGYYFVKWSDGLTTATRHDTNVTSAITVTAEFEIATFTVQYIVGDGGYLEGEAVQTVRYGEDATPVRITYDYSHYEFIKWSDGVESRERNDKNITEDLTVTAEYKKDTLNLRYIAGDGGRLIGNLNQYVKYKEYGEEVIAVPDSGYVFGGWSDAKESATRTDICNSNMEYVAYFEPIKKTFRYDYGIVSGMPLKSEITINRNELLNLQFVIPESPGYTFCGWYADVNYQLKVVDSDGTYMLGNYGLSLETDTLFAKWQKSGETEEGFVHKILLVVIQKIQAELPLSGSDNETTQVDYTMTSIEYGYCSYLQEIMQKRLNDWFKDTEIRFEVDSYYTLHPVGQEGFYNDNDSVIATENIVELGPLNAKYHNVITVEGLHNYDHAPSGLNVSGVEKYATILLDCCLRTDFLNNPGHIALEKWKTGNYTQLPLLEDHCFYLFIRTCAKNFTKDNGLRFYFYEYKDSRYDFLERVRRYLMREAICNGKEGGIPINYWRNDYNIRVYYSKSNESPLHCGKIVAVGDYSTNYEDVLLGLPYGSSMTVESIPYEGYRFVRWSDGITTARRTDTNIISHLRVWAYFVKID